MTISLPLYVHYSDSDGVSVTGITVTVDVHRITKASLAHSEIVTAGACTEIGDGVYAYLVTGADLATYDYVPVFKTADTTVRSKHLAAVRWDAAEIWATNLAFLDALITSRAAAADYTTLRAAKLDNLDATVSSRAAPGAAMDLITDAVDATSLATSAVSEIAAGVSDPLLSTVPGAYVSGTAGYALGRIGTGRISTVNPVAQDGAVNTWQYDSYAAADGRALDWTDDDDTWPTLTAAVVTVVIDGKVSFTGSVVTATGTGKKVRLELTSAQSATITPGGSGFQVIATVSSKPYTLVESVWTSHRRYAVSA